MIFSIEIADSNNARALSQLMSQLEAETSFLMYEHDEIPTAHDIERRINRGQELFLLAKDDANELVGYLLFSKGGVKRNAGVANISLAVTKESQGRGVGKALIREAVKTARRHSCYRLQLQVQTNNLIALGIYKKAGFEIEGTMRKCSFIQGQYIDKYQMALLL